MPPKRTPRGAGGAAKPDPYYATKDGIQNKMVQLVQDFDQWKYILDKKNTANDQSFGSLLENIRFSLKEVTGDINQVSKINAHVEQHRDRFPQINDEELNDRKGFVLEIKSRLNDIDTVLQSDRTVQKMNSDRERAAQPVRLKPGQSGDQYVQKRRMDTRNMEDEQDAVLDDMSSALSRLNTNATTIQTQLHTQTELIDEMDQRLDDNQNAMDVALNKMDKVLGKSAKGKWTIIIIEIIIVIVLLILLVV